MPRPLKLGLLGTGIAARKLYGPALSRLRGRVHLAACANRTLAKAQSFAADTGTPVVARDADALFAMADLDAVLISLPIDVQPAYVLKALKAGKAVLSEKPLAPSTAAGTRLLEAARPFERRGPVWMVAENYRFMPSAAWAEQRLAEGALGDLRLVEVRQSAWMDAKNPYYHTAWRRDPRFVGGFVVDAGVHLAHLVRRLLGQPTALKGLNARFNPSLNPIDSAVAVLRFGNGALGTWLSSFSCAAGGPMLTLRGSKASLDLHPDKAALIPRAGRPRMFRSTADSYALQFLDFADAVLKNRRPSYTPADALADLRLMEGVAQGRLLKP